MRSWLWPDHSIGKRESRVLREEHNALVNSHAELLAALRHLLSVAPRTTPDSLLGKAYEQAGAAIAKATGGE